MGFFTSLIGSLLGGRGSSSKSSAKKQHRQDTGRYGKKGAYRRERTGDRVGRDKKSGQYKK